MIGSKFGSGGLLGWISSSWSQADDSVLKYSLSNGYDGNGYVDGHMYTPGEAPHAIVSAHASATIGVLVIAVLCSQVYCKP